ADLLGIHGIPHTTAEDDTGRRAGTLEEISACVHFRPPLVPFRLHSHAGASVAVLTISFLPRQIQGQSRRWSSPDTLAERAHVGANAGSVDSVVTPTLSTCGAHVNAASGLVADNPDDDIVGEAEPTALLARLDAARIDIGGNNGPAWHRFRDVEGFVERPRHGQRGHDRRQIGVGSLLHLHELRAAIVDTTCALSRACR